MTIPLGDLRGIVGKRADAAHYDGDATIITKNGRPHAVIISYADYRKLIADTPNESPLIHQKTPEKS